MANAIPSDHEDLLQEVLLSVHAARATYDPTRPFILLSFTSARERRR
jgi:DNA-directed RNA polymerase specialized sigma24 family protein